MRDDEQPERERACPSCRRRSRLLSLLSARLDYCALKQGRLGEALALDDDTLMDAMGGGRRAALRAAYGQFDPAEPVCGSRHQAVCRHDGSYPPRLPHPDGPAMLFVAGGVDRLAALARAPMVAIVGAVRASDYGIEMARTIARGLAASGVAVTSSLRDGIGAGAQAGALEAGGGAVAVLGGGLDVACQAHRRSLLARTLESGCAVSELPCGCSGRRWGGIAAERIIAGLAEITVLVESDSERVPSIQVAQALDRALAAVPGRVTSQLSIGPHALLSAGVPLVRGAEDVLELLGDRHDLNLGRRASRAPQARRELSARLTTVLDLVGSGSDTPDELEEHVRDPGDVLLALSELELMGLLVRGDGGRYLRRE
jgi:DNA processing protein